MDGSQCPQLWKQSQKKIKQSFSGATFGKKTEQKQSIWTEKTEQNRFFLLTASQAQQKSLKKFQGVTGVQLKLLFLS